MLAETLPRLRLDGAPFDRTTQINALSAFAPQPSKLWFEVGFGSGEHALAQVAANPDIGLIACEVFQTGICALLSRLVPEGGEALAPLPANLRLWDGDARDLLRRLPDACLDRLFLLFPDPWPKARHAKRRFVHPALLPDLARVLKAGAEWRIASDDRAYQDWVAAILATQSLFDVPSPSRSRPDSWPSTRYEAKALAAGRSPLYWSLRRRPVHVRRHVTTDEAA